MTEEERLKRNAYMKDWYAKHPPSRERIAQLCFYQKERMKNPKHRARNTELTREWRANNRESYLEASRAAYKRNAEKRRQEASERRRKIRGVLNAMKLSKGCVDCGYNKHAAALDFDHVRGEKHGLVSLLKNKNLKSALAEAEKCDVRCANCHRVITHERRQHMTRGV